MTKYEFLGEIYGKSKLVLAVVRQYVNDNPNITFTDLSKAFPDSLQGTKGVVKLESSVSDAYRGIGGHRRYFVNANEIIALCTGERVLVSNQWGIHNINPFIEHVQKLGYKIVLL